LADFALHALDHLVGRELGAIKDDCVRGRLEGGQVPALVAAVALVLVPEDVVQRERDAAGEQLPVSAAGTLHTVGDEKEFTFRVGKDNRPLLAACAHEVAADGRLPLESGEEAPNRGQDRTSSHRAA
jgi:hypothetical protein